MTEMTEQAAAARGAQRTCGSAPAAQRTEALKHLDRLLGERQADILAANARDLAVSEDLSPVLRSRLGLTTAKLESLRHGVRTLAASEDPIGRVRSHTELADGLRLQQVSAPLGVLLVIFESRPDAVVQIGSLALRSGNALLLKGGSEARHSNAILVEVLRDALRAAGLPAEAVVGVEGRAAVAELLELDELLDLVIPRGSSALVRHIQSSTRIPVLGHAEGVCHTYVDASAEPGMAVRVVVDGKCDYPSACNATETLLVHRDAADQLSGLGEALGARGVALRAGPEALPHLPGATAATAADWGAEYGDLTLAVRVVPDLDSAIAHIHEHGSGHTEAIVAEDEEAARAFLARVDAASVFHNASTRFADGYRYGLGAEVGISTSRIHARGPVGVEGLLTSRWLLRGAGQGAGDFGPEGASFTHRALPCDLPPDDGADPWPALCRKAVEARGASFSPYSGFAVGSAVRASSGRIYTGANVEITSYGLTICAERAAVFAAVQAGEREITHVALVCQTARPVAPCGACRQVIMDFGAEAVVRSFNLDGVTIESDMASLLPHAFRPSDLVADDQGGDDR